MLFDNIFVLERFPVLDNRIRITKIIDLFHGLRREMLFAIGYSLKHLYLGGTEILRIILKHRGIDVEDLFQSQMIYIFRHFRNRETPDKIAQLLEIPGMARHGITDPLCHLCRD